MRLAATLSGAALIALLSAGMPGEARANEAPALEPYQLVRCLQLLQDRIAAGDHASLPMQRRLLEITDERIRSAEPAAFKDTKNFRALLIYAMSGGNPLTIEQVVSRLTLEDADRGLAQGVIEYLRGKPKGTVAAFASIDPMTQSSELGAFLALVKGSVSLADEPEKAVALLDQARLLSPGTLVEEAALRRSVALTPRLQDGGRFLRASTQYVRAYLHSPYASQFADAFVAGVVALNTAVNLDAVAEITAMMDAEQEKVIYLRIARRAAIDGHTELSAFAARKAEQRRDGQGDGADPRAQLYSGLSAVTSGAPIDLLSMLGGIDREKLSKGDRALLEAVEAVTSEMTAAVPLASDKPVDIANLPPASTDIEPMPEDPMVPDAAEVVPPPPPANVIQEPAVASEPANTADTTAPAVVDDPAIVGARRKLEDIDQLLGASQMTDGVSPALPSPLARHLSSAERAAQADGDEQADFGRALLSPKKDTEAQAAKERHLDSDGPREKRWHKLAERLAATQSGEAGAKGEADAVEELLVGAGEKADAAEPPLDEPAGTDTGRTDTAEGAALPLLLALSELRKASTQPMAATSSVTSAEAAADQPAQSSDEATGQRPAPTPSPARASTGVLADPTAIQVAATSEANSALSAAPQPATGSVTSNVAATGNKPSRPVPERQPEQAIAANRVTVISEQAIPAPVTSGTGTTAGALALDIGSEALRHTAAATAVQQLQATASSGTAAHVLKIQLRPIELGMVTASLNLSGDQLTVEIQVENAEAYHRLSADRDTINNALRGLGFDVDRVTIQQPQAQARNDGDSFSPGSGGREHPAFQSGETGGERGSSGNGRAAGRAANEDGNAHNTSTPPLILFGGSRYI